jgi:hypothetical protein
MRRAGSVRFFVSVLVIAFSCCSPGFARSWKITEFADNISVQQDGTTSVQERITLQFEGEWHGIHRRLPVEYPGPNGTNYTLFLDHISVTDEDGRELKFERHRSGDFLDLKIPLPGAVNTTLTVRIQYIVRNGVRYFPDYDEFYWNVTGLDWPVPIDRASGFVQLPPQAAGSLRAQAFTGVYGSKERDATSQVDGAQVMFETTKPLPMRGGLTIDVFIPKGILREPSSLTRLIWFLGSNLILFLPFVTLGVMFTFWYYKGRDPDAGRSVAPMYEPPAGMSPAETGALVDDTVHPRDITSTLVDMAVRGYIKIVEKNEKGLLFTHKDYVFQLLKPQDQWQDMAPHERVMMSNIFFGGEGETRLSSLKNRFYTAIPPMTQDIKSALRQKGMYLLDPDSANGYSIVGAMVSIGPFLAMQFTGWKPVFNSVIVSAVSIAISALIWWLFARQMTAKTLKGAQTLVAILGFQEFMNRVDADRLKRMPPDTFEKYLPYAMALGVEHHWAQAFAGIIKDPPSWYVASGPYTGFNPVLFSGSMHSMAVDAQQVFASAPRSSSSGSGWSGGGGGGGFSGGGFGGGGGSAW